jgi:hypothetical protein
MQIISIIALIIIAIVDLPKLRKQKELRDLIIYCVFFTSALVLVILLSFDVKIPSPIKGAQYLIKDIFHMSYK